MTEITSQLEKILTEYGFNIFRKTSSSIFGDKYKKIFGERDIFFDRAPHNIEAHITMMPRENCIGYCIEANEHGGGDLSSYETAESDLREFLRKKFIYYAFLEMFGSDKCKTYMNDLKLDPEKMQGKAEYEKGFVSVKDSEGIQKLYAVGELYTSEYPLLFEIIPKGHLKLDDRIQSEPIYQINVYSLNGNLHLVKEDVPEIGQIYTAEEAKKAVEGLKERCAAYSIPNYQKIPHDIVKAANSIQIQEGSVSAVIEARNQMRRAYATK